MVRRRREEKRIRNVLHANAGANASRIAVGRSTKPKQERVCAEMAKKFPTQNHLVLRVSSSGADADTGAAADAAAAGRGASRGAAPAA